MGVARQRAAYCRVVASLWACGYGWRSGGFRGGTGDVQLTAGAWGTGPNVYGAKLNNTGDRRRLKVGR